MRPNQAIPSLRNAVSLTVLSPELGNAIIQSHGPAPLPPEAPTTGLVVVEVSAARLESRVFQQLVYATSIDGSSIRTIG